MENGSEVADRAADMRKRFEFRSREAKFKQQQRLALAQILEGAEAFAGSQGDASEAARVIERCEAFANSSGLW